MSHRTAITAFVASALLVVFAAGDVVAQCSVLNASPNPVTVNTPLTLTWTAPTSACTTPTQPNFVGYRVYVQAPGSGTFTMVGTTATGDRDFQYTPTQTGTYTFKVAAVYTNQVCGECMITEGDSNSIAVTSQAPCSYMIAPTSNNVPSAGGGGTITVTTAAGCAWSAGSAASFITITGGASGSGNGTVTYMVSANSGAARTGTLLVAGQTFTVNQAAVACTYLLEPAVVDISAAGATGNFIVMTAPGCSWNAMSTVPFVTVTSGSGTGSGTVSYSVQANSGLARQGAIIVADTAGFIIRQAAVAARPVRRRAVRH